MELSLEEVKEQIIADAANAIERAVITFEEVKKFTIQDLDSIGALIEEAKENLNSESIQDMHRIVTETMRSFYHLDLSICELFTLDSVINKGKILRLYSAYEMLMDYDEKIQEQLEDGYAEEV